MTQSLYNSLQTFTVGDGSTGSYYSLPELEKAGVGPISRLPICIRIVLESVLRNCDEKKVREQDVINLANWGATAERTEEVPFVVARVILQDFTGVPLLVDLAAMRSQVALLDRDTSLIEPLVPVDLVIDHSVQVDYSGTAEAYEKNIEAEFQRNEQRYRFLKWGTQAFNGFRVVPPGIGIVHQVNMEYLARGVWEKHGVYYPDTLVGTDSHTTMINGLGIVGWGVGGIEAEAGMLGQPVYILTPDVVGVDLTGTLSEGVTATDLVLRVTQMLREAKVVGKFVEFHGEGAASLPATDRATIANMAPEYGATMGFFPVDEATCSYFAATGRTDAQVTTLRNYYKAQGLFGIPASGEIDYTTLLQLHLGSIEPAVAGPKRPQDLIELSSLKQKFNSLMQAPVAKNGYGKTAEEVAEEFVVRDWDHASGVADGAADVMLGHGDVVIAAITSCTNTSNPSVMLAAGLVAKKAVERGLRVPATVKTSLAPGSRAVTAYLERTGLQTYLDQLGFNLVGYGCTTCIGNSGPLDPRIEATITGNDLISASVLSGNRNFEARVHQNVKANFLMSPPLVVAFALAGRVDVDLSKEPVGQDDAGKDVFLADLWPSLAEVAALLGQAFDPVTYRNIYSDFADDNPLWNQIPSSTGSVYEWDRNSTYIQQPPYFENFSMAAGKFTDIKTARALAIFGDSVTTDHISPAGSIKPSSPAGLYLQAEGVTVANFNSYGSRRGNHEVMLRGTFANVRIKNLMVAPKEGGVTLHQPAGVELSIYDAAMQYQKDGVPLIVFAGQEYGTGSSRDWAAKGSMLMGIKAVVAQSFERIHRSNLVGMGILPLQFADGTSAKSLGLTGTETFDLTGLETGEVRPRQDVTLLVHRSPELTETVTLTLRIDTPIELEYYQHGGILPYVLRQLLG